MADLKQLFHSPEELSNEELVLIKRKVMLMNQTPYYGMLFGVAGAACFETLFFRRNPTLLRLAVGAAVGYSVGGLAASSVTRSALGPARKFDVDIMFAHEARQQRKVMNLAGYGQNYISRGHTELDRSFDKPY